MKRWIYALGPVFCLLGLAWIQISAGGVYFDRWTQDLFIPLEGANQLLHGRQPHRDFSTPVGFIYYFVHYIPAAFFGLSAKTTVLANLLVALALVVATPLLLARRLPAWILALIALYIGLLALSPRQLGSLFSDITYNAAYNRHSWALIALLALLIALPRATNDKSSKLSDGVPVGLLLLVLFFLKMTYFAIGVVLCGAAVLTVRRNAAAIFSIHAAVIVVVGLLAVQLTTGLVSDYLIDIRRAAEVLSNPLRTQQALNLLNFSASGFVLVMVVGLMAPKVGEGIVGVLQRLVFPLFICLAGVLIGVQNHLALENPLLPVAAIVASATMLPQSLSGLKKVSQVELGSSAASVAATVGLILMSLVQDTAACIWTGVVPFAKGNEQAWLQKTAMKDLHVSAKASTRLPGHGHSPASEAEYIQVLGDGLALLRRHVQPGMKPRVLSLTWSNPFPVLLGSPPIRNELSWWDVGRTFNSKIFPSGASLLSEVDYILIPSYYPNSETTQAMVQIYAVELARDYRRIDSSPTWSLYARGGCAAPGSC